MIGEWKAYLLPFEDDGTYASTWLDVSADVDFGKIGSLSTELDNTEYDIGIFRNSGIKVVLRNREGLYSDVGFDKSIFKYRRSETQVKITYRPAAAPICGFAVAGDSMLSSEVTVFVGLLNDDSTAMNLDSSQIEFTALGRESRFQREIVPYASIAIGQLASVAIYSILNQTGITKLMTVAQVNIVCGVDKTLDAITPLQNKTVTEALKILLLASNSVLRIVDNTVYVSARTPTAGVMGNFYGQASALGPENIAAINAIKSGLAKAFNYFTWKGTALAVADSASGAIYGNRKKEVDADIFTNSGKQTDVLNSLLAEFATLKQEFELIAPLTLATVELTLLDRVSIDYPTVYIPDENPYPLCGLAVCGTAILPIAAWEFILDPLDYYKIIGKSLNINSGEVRFNMRLI